MAAEVVLVGDLGERLSGLAECVDVGVAECFGGGAWFEWSPGPALCVVEGLLTVLGEFAVFVALAHVADPSPECDLLAVEFFGVGCGDECVAFALDVLL